MRDILRAAGADRLTDQNGARAGDPKRRHERHRVDLERNHERGERGGAESRHQDINEKAEGQELEEPVQAHGETKAQQADELPPDQPDPPEDARRADSGQEEHKKEGERDACGEGARQRRPSHAKGGGAQVAVDQHPVAEDVEPHRQDARHRRQPRVPQPTVEVVQRLHPHRRPAGQQAQLQVAAHQAMDLALIPDHTQDPGHAGDSRETQQLCEQRHTQAIPSVAPRGRGVSFTGEL